MLIVVSQIHVRSWRLLRAFLRLSGASVQQARRSRGNLGVRVRPRSLLVWCTLTGWENEAAMVAFVRSDAHLVAMKNTQSFTDSTRFTRFVTDEDFADIRWADALVRLEQRQ